MSVDFDHLVLMMRDQLLDRAPRLQEDGFHLTGVSVHNLGSINQLITLDSSYIELLGWPAGQPPARKEIAEQPLGLDALVFRPRNAGDTFEQLRRAGFEVNPVQRLERLVPTATGTGMARFDTVRFARQPIPGLRIYYCQHLTPEYIWNESVMQHENGAQSLREIVVKAPDARSVADTLAVLTEGQVLAAADDGFVLNLPNLRLMVVPDARLSAPVIWQAALGYRDGTLRPFVSPI
ncbi:VOC family protein [Pusillimonas sp. MFBS29]|uniref:VOC family protein n=1 Tax=Pusillimonas sp. MFBS29 TaxID=2886690 RepID=UPI001D0FF912|nr:VOC family protein [Pusillimonas sp. MFBS29]MCC2597693.1 VOC family protein [Pusillimonas sp. MFBS29]